MLVVDRLPQYVPALTHCTYSRARSQGRGPTAQGAQEKTKGGQEEGQLYPLFGVSFNIVSYSRLLQAKENAKKMELELELEEERERERQVQEKERAAKEESERIAREAREEAEREAREAREAQKQVEKESREAKEQKEKAARKAKELTEKQVEAAEERKRKARAKAWREEKARGGRLAAAAAAAEAKQQHQEQQQQQNQQQSQLQQQQQSRTAPAVGSAEWAAQKAKDRGKNKATGADKEEDGREVQQVPQQVFEKVPQQVFERDSHLGYRLESDDRNRSIVSHQDAPVRNLSPAVRLHDIRADQACSLSRCPNRPLYHPVYRPLSGTEAA